MSSRLLDLYGEKSASPCCSFLLLLPDDDWRGGGSICAVSVEEVVGEAREASMLIGLDRMGCSHCFSTSSSVRSPRLRPAKLP